MGRNGSTTACATSRDSPKAPHARATSAMKSGGCAKYACVGMSGVKPEWSMSRAASTTNPAPSQKYGRFRVGHHAIAAPTTIATIAAPSAPRSWGPRFGGRSSTSTNLEHDGPHPAPDVDRARERRVVNALRPADGENEIVPADASPSCVAPVSYTHLDVYKRQDP